MLDSTVGSGSGSCGRGAAIVVVVAMEGETGSTSFVTECIPTGSESSSSS